MCSFMLEKDIREQLDSMSSLNNQIAPFRAIMSVIARMIICIILSAECVCIQCSTVSGSALVIDIDDREEL